MRLAVAIDSNLLLLLIVGSASRDYIAKHKRLKSFDSSDFDLLREQLSVASAIVLTPQYTDRNLKPHRSHRRTRSRPHLSNAAPSSPPSRVRGEVRPEQERHRAPRTTSTRTDRLRAARHLRERGATHHRRPSPLSCGRQPRCEGAQLQSSAGRARIDGVVRCRRPTPPSSRSRVVSYDMR